jgi:hypothetical protein
MFFKKKEGNMQPVLEDKEAKNAVKLVVKSEGLRDYSHYASVSAKRRLDVKAVLRLVKKDVDLYDALKMPAVKTVQIFILYLVWKNFQSRIECVEVGRFYTAEPALKISSVERQGERIVVGLHYKNSRYGLFFMNTSQMKLADDIN